MLNKLLLNCGNDIPFEEAGLIIHPPTVEEIGYIGEKSLWHGVEFLNFSKEFLDNKDKNNLTSISDFEILMSIINNDSVEMKTHLTQMKLVLALLFPNYKISIASRSIIFTEEIDGEKEHRILDENNFNEFKKYIRAIFCLNQLKGIKGEQDYNPSGAMAAALAEKFKARRKKIAEINKKNGKGSGLDILDLYISILSVGLQKDKNELIKYTVYQLFDEFERFNLEMAFDINMKARLAGATKLKDAENWMQEIHTESDFDI